MLVSRMHAALLVRLLTPYESRFFEAGTSEKYKNSCDFYSISSSKILFSHRGAVFCCADRTSSCTRLSLRIPKNIYLLRDNWCKACFTTAVSPTTNFTYHAVFPVSGNLPKTWRMSGARSAAPVSQGRMVLRRPILQLLHMFCAHAPDGIHASDHTLNRVKTGCSHEAQLFHLLVFQLLQLHGCLTPAHNFTGNITQRTHVYMSSVTSHNSELQNAPAIYFHCGGQAQLTLLGVSQSLQHNWC